MDLRIVVQPLDQRFDFRLSRVGGKFVRERIDPHSARRLCASCSRSCATPDYPRPAPSPDRAQCRALAFIFGHIGGQFFPYPRGNGLSINNGCCHLFCLSSKIYLKYQCLLRLSRSAPAAPVIPFVFVRLFVKWVGAKRHSVNTSRHVKLFFKSPNATPLWEKMYVTSGNSLYPGRTIGSREKYADEARAAAACAICRSWRPRPRASRATTSVEGREHHFVTKDAFQRADRYRRVDRIHARSHGRLVRHAAPGLSKTPCTLARI